MHLAFLWFMQTETLSLVLLLQELQERECYYKYKPFCYLKICFFLANIWRRSPLTVKSTGQCTATALGVFIQHWWRSYMQTQQHCLHGRKTDINTPPHPNPQPCLVLLCLPSCRQNQRVSLCLRFSFVDWNMEMYFFYGASKGGTKTAEKKAVWDQKTFSSRLWVWLLCSPCWEKKY